MQYCNNCVRDLRIFVTWLDVPLSDVRLLMAADVDVVLARRLPYLHRLFNFTWSYGETAKECRLYATTSCSRRSQVTLVRISIWAGNTVHIIMFGHSQYSVFSDTRILNNFRCHLFVYSQQQCAEQPPSISPSVRREKMTGSPGGVPRLPSKTPTARLARGIFRVDVIPNPGFGDILI